MRDLLPCGRPALVLVPMQDVTDLAFMRVIARRGAPDWFVTEYFRVHPDFSLRSYILRSIKENVTGRPVFAQVIGSDVPSLVRAARLLAELPVAGIDLNLGCPAPIVCRKHAGGAWLKDPAGVGRLLGMMRAVISGRFTVKTRVGYADAGEFAQLLEIFRACGLDGLTVHARTVGERYQTPVHPECVRMAVAAMPCPVIANGNVVDTATGLALLEQSQAAGLMIGRGAIRNPWLFRQIREHQRGEPIFIPRGTEVLAYVRALYEAVCLPAARESEQVQRMKKYMNYLGVGVEPTGQFLHQIRRVKTTADLFRVCAESLDHDQPMPLEPFLLALKEGDLMAGEQR